jgi:uncharacterized protein YeaO (DUF488 family)
MDIKIKRAYELPTDNDGARVLVDRLWPRGLTKERAKIDVWMKEIAPTTELRKWFGHDSLRWDEFRARYILELKSNIEGVRRLKELIEAGPVTLIYASRDEQHNEAVVLRDNVKLIMECGRPGWPQ